MTRMTIALLASGSLLLAACGSTATAPAAATASSEASSSSWWNPTTATAYVVHGINGKDLKLAEDMARKAAEMAIRLLPAEDAPAGEFPIVVAKGFGGIFFHEAIGHSLEADGIRKKTPCFWDKLGKPIAAKNVRYNYNICGSWCNCVGGVSTGLDCRPN